MSSVHPYRIGRRLICGGTRNEEHTEMPVCRARESTMEAPAIFHDPVRTVRIDPAFGGVLATKQSGSCGSCHQGESASKAGTLLNFSVGGEGRSYTDAKGTFIPRRRPQVDILPKLRDTPLFPS